MDSKATQTRLTQIIEAASRRIAVIVVRSTKQRLSLNAMNEVMTEVSAAIREWRTWRDAPPPVVSNPFDDEEPLHGDTPTIPDHKRK